MRLIVNTSNIVVGGGIQVSLSFIEELKKFEDNEYHLFLSAPVAKQLDKKSFPTNFNFYYFDTSPSSLTKGLKVRRELDRLEKNIQPDLVFTVFGPAYWKPRAIHISGFANGWCYNPNSIAYKRLTTTKKLKSKISTVIKNFEIKRADYLIVETDDAKNKINKFLKFPNTRIYVVGNTYHPIYNIYKTNHSIHSIHINKKDEDFKLLVLSAFYPHKNLDIIKDVVNCLQTKTSKRFTFYLTIKDEEFRKAFPESQYIINLGPQNIEDCPELYNNSDALFLPTLLETFSANYPEAMIMRKPILTSGFDFSKEVCRDAALYFDPLDPEDIADKIIQLEEDKILYYNLIEKGSKRVLELETSESRAQKYMRIFKDVLEKEL